MATQQHERQVSSTTTSDGLVYEYVYTIFVHWGEDDLGVEHEQFQLNEALGKFSSETYRYMIPPPYPEGESGDENGSTIVYSELDALKEYIDHAKEQTEKVQSGLFILCYAGHGGLDENRELEISVNK